MKEGIPAAGASISKPPRVINKVIWDTDEAWLQIEDILDAYSQPNHWGRKELNLIDDAKIYDYLAESITKARQEIIQTKAQNKSIEEVRTFVRNKLVQFFPSALAPEELKKRIQDDPTKKSKLLDTELLFRAEVYPNSTHTRIYKEETEKYKTTIARLELKIKIDAEDYQKKHQAGNKVHLDIVAQEAAKQTKLKQEYDLLKKAHDTLNEQEKSLKATLAEKSQTYHKLEQSYKNQSEQMQQQAKEWSTKSEQLEQRAKELSLKSEQVTNERDQAILSLTAEKSKVLDLSNQVQKIQSEQGELQASLQRSSEAQSLQAELHRKQMADLQEKMDQKLNESMEILEQKMKKVHIVSEEHFVQPQEESHHENDGWLVIARNLIFRSDDRNEQPSASKPKVAKKSLA